MYYTDKQRQYKELAAAWKKVSENMDLSEEQKKGMALFFKPIARRFGLTQDFKDIGVI
jgi:hypothetical protein